jgi:plastocyanin
VIVRVVSDMSPYFDAGDMSHTNVEYEIDQKGCIYEPRVSIVRVAQPVAFINSDPIFHNVKSSSKNNPNFNINMPKQGQRDIKYFEKPEIVLITKCSVHPWMSAYIGIVEHPFFALSNANGEFEIKNLPVGKHTIEFWHETLGVQTREIEVTESGIKELAITYKK